MADQEKRVSLQYFAAMREQRGVSSESRVTHAATLRGLFDELRKEFGFDLHANELKVAVNGDFAELGDPLRNGDDIVFIPPVAGGAA